MSDTKKEVSESAFEYLISELIFSVGTSCNEEDQNEANNIKKIENMGYEIGFRYVENISGQQKLIGRDPLDLMKFICKDLWEELFRKKIDKLQTNHRGVFVLSDFSFKWLDRYDIDNVESTLACNKLINFICGILRGALSNLGLVTIVTADPINSSPIGCTFNVKLKSTS